jgi:peptidoglycan-N-acetylglucosamine deacetylase
VAKTIKTILQMTKLVPPYLLLIMAMIVFAPGRAQTKTDLPGKSWNGRKCAVVLTYDDALNVHITNALPILDSLKLKATFYLSDYFGGLQLQLPAWKKAAARGHELGNHTLFHPCRGSLPGRSFVKAEYDLDHYSISRITDEIKTMNMLLHQVDGKTERTFAFPCSDTKVHDTAYIDGLRSHFAGARAVRSEILPIKKVNLFDIGCFMVNGQSGEQLIKEVKEAMNKGGLLVFLFHGVGGEHGLNVSLEAHRQLLNYLKMEEKNIWIAPMITVAKFVQQQSSKSN